MRFVINEDLMIRFSTAVWIDMFHGLILCKTETIFLILLILFMYLSLYH